MFLACSNSDNDSPESEFPAAPQINLTTVCEISTLIENNNWLIALTFNNEIYISKIIDEKIPNCQKLKLEGLEFIDDYIYISAMSFHKGKLLIGTSDLNNVGKISPTQGKGVYATNISF